MAYNEERIKVPRFNEESGFYTTKKRSRIMSRIKGKNSKPEMIFRKALWAKGVRYRVNNKNLPGKPDITIKKYKLAIFIDGEFWHGYNWDERKETIKSNRGFWIPKIERNIQRDKEVNQQLAQMGFTVLRFWQREVKTDLKKCINDVMVYLQTGSLDW
ncbi:very short patch repair endonuclease [Galbibacter mesophilus]|uniref:very short patch repair endonuclease n=1 Tax=Galbibacter mesophilus TaxID=379069 RepID=UPI00191EAB34|nr:very short patch repair endonuclease [Galbibacter mesophilus]MCM5661943.1 very short patch repair endonuclease [Galbibacter mesophilus]